MKDYTRLNEERREQTLQRREETTTSEGWFDEGLHETAHCDN